MFRVLSPFTLCHETRKFHGGPLGNGQFVTYKTVGKGNKLTTTTLGLWQRLTATAEVLKVAQHA